jgi:hypothetical protein
MRYVISTEPFVCSAEGLEFGNSVYWITFGEEYAEKVNSAKIVI